MTHFLDMSIFVGRYGSLKGKKYIDHFNLLEYMNPISPKLPDKIKAAS